MTVEKVSPKVKLDVLGTLEGLEVGQAVEFDILEAEADPLRTCSTRIRIKSGKKLKVSKRGRTTTVTRIK